MPAPRTPPPVKITTVKDNRMHNGGPTRSPVIIYHCTVWGTNSAPLHSGLHAGPRRRLTVDSSLTSTATNISRGRQTSSRTSASMQLPPSRGMLYDPDRPGHMAYGRSKHIDRRQPQRAGGARADMRDRRGPRPVARARPRSWVQGDSYRGVRSETILQLGEVSPDVK